MMFTSRSRLVGAGIAALLGAASGLVVGAPATAAGTGYVALGDSYSSGTGTRSYLADGTSCQRSVYAYPSLDAAALGLSLTFRACSGATVADVSATQLSALTSSTAYVTISVGGNDAGFADVLTTCALPGWLSNCNKAIDGARNVISATLPTRLAKLYSSEAAMDNARAATRSAIGRSGSTACPARSARATTPTAPGTPAASSR